MKIKLEACQPYFTVSDPLYKLNDSPPMNAEEIGEAIKTITTLIRKSKIKGVYLPFTETYIPFNWIDEEMGEDDGDEKET